jgi:hypothetical protein
MFSLDFDFWQNFFCEEKCGVLKIVWFKNKVIKHFVFFNNENDMSLKAALCAAVGGGRACLEGVCFFRKWKMCSFIGH